MHTGKFSLEYKEAIIVSTDKKGDKETIKNHHTQALSILAYANAFIKRPEKQIKFIHDDSLSSAYFMTLRLLQVISVKIYSQ